MCRTQFLYITVQCEDSIPLYYCTMCRTQFLYITKQYEGFSYYTICRTQLLYNVYDSIPLYYCTMCRTQLCHLSVQQHPSPVPPVSPTTSITHVICQSHNIHHLCHLSVPQHPSPVSSVSPTTSITRVICQSHNIHHPCHLSVPQHPSFTYASPLALPTCTMHDLSGGIQASGFSLNPEASKMQCGGRRLSNVCQCSASCWLSSASCFFV